jgi:hypothetical protein
MRRGVVALVASLLVAGTAAGAALADPADDARAAADRFLTALQAGDTTAVCGLVTAHTLELIGGAERCAKLLTANEDEPTSTPAPTAKEEDRARDILEQYLLSRVFDEARALGLGRGGYTSETATLATFVRQLRTLDPHIRYSIGKGAKAARGLPFMHVVVGTATSGRKLVLYAESDSGAIWELDAQGFTHSKLRKAGRGVRAPAQKPRTSAPAGGSETEAVSLSIDGVTLTDPLSATVDVTETYEEVVVPFQLKLKLENGQWLVDDLLVSAFAVLARQTG